MRMGCNGLMPSTPELDTAALLIQGVLIPWLRHQRQYRHRAEWAARETLSALTHLNRIATAGDLSATIAHTVKQPPSSIVARQCGAALALGSKAGRHGHRLAICRSIVTARDGQLSASSSVGKGSGLRARAPGVQGQRCDGFAGVRDLR